MELQTAKHGKIWLWLDERVGLGDIAKKQCRCTAIASGTTSAA
jgi:hypothetical protein